MTESGRNSGSGRKEKGMFINKAGERNNLCGLKIGELRRQKGLSQRGLAEEMKRLGIDIGKNQIQRIECGDRFVTDIELAAFAAYFCVPAGELIGTDSMD